MLGVLLLYTFFFLSNSINKLNYNFLVVIVVVVVVVVANVVVLLVHFFF